MDQTVKETRNELTLCCRRELYRPFTMLKAEYMKAKQENVNHFAMLRHNPVEGSPRPPSTFCLVDNNGITRHYSATNDNLLTVVAAYGYRLSSHKDLARLHEDE